MGSEARFALGCVAYFAVVLAGAGIGTAIGIWLGQMLLR